VATSLVELVRRLARVAAKLAAARADGPRTNAEQKHRFSLLPPLGEQEVAAYEERNGVRLPEDYRLFITRLGNGGAGPYHGGWITPSGACRTPRSLTSRPCLINLGYVALGLV
jgi:hypothetical protein